jgi:hypothetical protein
LAMIDIAIPCSLTVGGCGMTKSTCPRPGSPSAPAGLVDDPDRLRRELLARQHFDLRHARKRLSRRLARCGPRAPSAGRARTRHTAAHAGCERQLGSCCEASPHPAEIISSAGRGPTGRSTKAAPAAVRRPGFGATLPRLRRGLEGARRGRGAPRGRQMAVLRRRML